MSNDNKEPKLKSGGEIREEVIKDFGLDPDEETHQDLINKITSERLDHQKKLSTAISQKINYRKAKDFYKQAATTEPEPKEPITPGEIDKDKYVTKEDLAKIQLRQAYSFLPDDEFDFINAQANGDAEKFKQVLESPIVKTYLATSEAQARIANATSSPSTRFKPSSVSEEDKIADELDSDLPIGFVSKKN